MRIRRAVMLALGLLAACEHPSADPQVAPTDPRTGAGTTNEATLPALPTAVPAANTSWVALRTELDDLGEAIERRRENAISDCMAQLGFDYEPIVASLAGSPEQVWFGDYSSNVEWAEKHGYRSPELVESLSEESTDVPAERNAGYHLALMGEPGGTVEVTSPLTSVVTMGYEKRGGCWAEADIAVFGSVERGEQYLVAYEVADSVLYELLFNADASPELAEPLNEWRQCMADRGYEAPGTPGDFSRETSSEGEGDVEFDGTVPDSERIVAVADHRCRAQAGLEAAYKRALNGYLEPQLDVLNEQMDVIRELAVPPKR